MRPICLAALLLLSPALQARELDTPQGLTLSVGADGVSRLSWEAVFADDLMGYSVWKRFEGSGAEFTLISVPVKVGKEVRKLPMTTATRYAFKDAKPRDAEFVVVAEYESGRSKPSPAAKTRLALREAPKPEAPAGPPVDGPVPPAEASAPTPGPARAPALQPQEEEAPEPERLPAARRSLLTPPGKFRTGLYVDYSYHQTDARGRDSIENLFFGYADPSFTLYNWNTAEVRRSLRVPLSVDYGLFPGLELGAEGVWADEISYPLEFKFDGYVYYDYRYIVRRRESAGLGNVWLKARAMPLDPRPLLLEVASSLPLGLSRFKSWADYELDLDSGAGTDEGASRLRVSLQWGDKWGQAGMHYFASYMPSASETQVLDLSGTKLSFQAVYGSSVEFGGGYGFPFSFMGQPSSLIAVIKARSVSPGRVYNGGQDIGARMNRMERARFDNEAGISLIQQDQLELSLEWEQYLRAGASSRGRIYSTLKPDGFILGLGGGFLY